MRKYDCKQISSQTADVLKLSSYAIFLQSGSATRKPFLKPQHVGLDAALGTCLPGVGW